MVMDQLLSKNEAVTKLYWAVLKGNGRGLIMYTMKLSALHYRLFKPHGAKVRMVEDS